jgi:hypothetical protein
MVQGLCLVSRSGRKVVSVAVLIFLVVVFAGETADQRTGR